jgi:alkylation response protein AidB-like acyl-CoA dehydrogenase
MFELDNTVGVNYGEITKMVTESAKGFSEQHIRPNVMEWDESQFFPATVLKKAGDLGFMGVLIPEIYGGSGMGYHEYIAIIEEISKVDPSIGLSVAAHNSLATQHLYLFGNEEQRMKWLPKLASGQWLGAWGLTEYNTGSDAKGMNATAKKEGDHWVLNGTKNFITHGKSCDLAVVIFRNGDKGDSHGMTSFVIEKGTPGFSSGKVENKLGMRASETAEMVFDNCIVPDSHRLGEVGEGFIQSMKILDGGRISIAALSLGIAKGAFEASIKYAKEREQFGKPIGSFQGISFMLADMATEIEAASLMTHQAGEDKNHGKNVTQIGAMAKLFASEVCVKVANNAVQIHGGYGFTKDFPVEKFFRDSKLCTIGEGTSEIQKLVIARNLLKS